MTPSATASLFDKLPDNVLGLVLGALPFYSRKDATLVCRRFRRVALGSTLPPTKFRLQIPARLCKIVEKPGNGGFLTNKVKVLEPLAPPATILSECKLALEAWGPTVRCMRVQAGTLVALADALGLGWGELLGALDRFLPLLVEVDALTKYNERLNTFEKEPQPTVLQKTMLFAFQRLQEIVTVLGHRLTRFQIDTEYFLDEGKEGNSLLVQAATYLPNVRDWAVGGGLSEGLGDDFAGRVETLHLNMGFGEGADERAEVFKRLAKYHNLTDLTLDYASEEMSCDDELFGQLCDCTNLKKLRLYDYAEGGYSIVNEIPYLEKLEVLIMTVQLDESCFDSLSKFTNLRHIDIGVECVHMENPLQCPNLTYARFVNEAFGGNSGSASLECLKDCKSLRTLVFDGYEVDFSGIEDFTNLEVLRVTALDTGGEPLISKEVYAKLSSPNCCPKLRRVREGGWWMEFKPKTTLVRSGDRKVLLKSDEESEEEDSD